MFTTPQLDWDTICRRAGGRRKYNRLRQLRAEYRLIQVVQLLKEIGFCHGYQTCIAEALNVSRPTICRDMAKLLRRHWGGKEAEEQHRNQERIQRRIQAEDKVARDRMASEKARSDGDGAAPASPKPEVPPLTANAAPAICPPRRVSSPHSAPADLFRPRRARQARHVRGCR